jgi:tartrate dehydrogenase/decarboxylase/D-malate dehydrogenase
LPSPLGSGPDFNLLIVRENTEGEYIDVGGRPFSGRPSEMAVQVAIFTAAGIERAVEDAFGRVPAGGLLTSVTKSNALPRTMGLWDDIAQAVADRHPDVRWERMHVDAVAFQMVRDPGRFDVLVASNLFGDILSDLGAGLQGSLGFAASGNVNPERGVGIFEPIHGSAPDIAGEGRANPCGAINSVAMLLDFLGETRAAATVTAAVDRTLADGVATPDVGGTATTVEFTDEVLARLSAAGDVDDASQRPGGTS